MYVKAIAFALIGAAAIGTVAVPAWHALPHTMRVPLEEYDVAARRIFAQPLPDSVQIMDCAIRQTPAGKDVNEVAGVPGSPTSRSSIRMDRGSEWLRTCAISSFVIERGGSAPTR